MTHVSTLTREKPKLLHEQRVNHFYNRVTIFIQLNSPHTSTPTQQHFVHLPYIIYKNENAVGHPQPRFAAPSYLWWLEKMPRPQSRELQQTIKTILR